MMLCVDEERPKLEVDNLPGKNLRKRKIGVVGAEVDR
jgi:hypothetical protein